MDKPTIEVEAIEASKVLAAWDEIGYDKPAKEVWPTAIEIGTNKVLIARLGGVAIGTVDIMLNGPIVADESFREVTKSLYPDQFVAAAYGLYVSTKFRRLGAASVLIKGAETEVTNDPKLANVLALTVNSDDDVVLSMFEKLNYSRRQEIAQVTPVWDEDAKKWKPQEITSWVLTKELNLDIQRHNINAGAQSAESAQADNPEDITLTKFYEEIFADAQSVEELRFGFKATFLDIDIPLAKIKSHGKCKVLKDKMSVVEVPTAVAQCPDGKILILTESIT